jgi:hypothetical protein
MAKCDWYDDTLSVVLPEDPKRIAVRLFDSRLAPARIYVPEVETQALKDENTKLRDLVFDLWDFFCLVPDDPHTPKEELDFIVEVWKRMRELGIEMDE